MTCSGLNHEVISIKRSVISLAEDGQALHELKFFQQNFADQLNTARLWGVGSLMQRAGIPLQQMAS